MLLSILYLYSTVFLAIFLSITLLFCAVLKLFRLEDQHHGPTDMEPLRNLLKPISLGQ